MATAVQLLVASDVEVLVLARPTKARRNGPPLLEHVSGHREVFSGLGSVIFLDGRPGDPLVTVHHVKPIRDRVKPFKTYRAPTDHERAALEDLRTQLEAYAGSTDAEALQNLVYEIGKAHGFEPLRDWFKAIYQVLLGDDQGPRFGSFIALYGVGETRRLIEEALEGKLLA